MDFPQYPEPLVLTVTADVRFYAAVSNTEAFAVEWAPSLARAIEICRSKSVPIVIYDCNLPGVDWESAFDWLSIAGRRPRMLLAASSLDESVWENVIEHAGYDAVDRRASSAELKRALRFAWLSLTAGSPS